jgi:hypothetical protein
LGTQQDCYTKTNVCQNRHYRWYEVGGEDKLLLMANGKAAAPADDWHEHVGRG